MRQADLVVKNARVYTPHGSYRGGVAVCDGIIVAVGEDGVLPQGRETIDAEGKALLPGLIDAHVHVRAPGREDCEDFYTGTCAAANGGFTTILEMPVSTPGVSTADILLRRAGLAAQDAVVDFGLYGGGGESNIAHIAEMAEAGAVGFKTFMHGPPRGREADYDGVHVLDDKALLEVFRAVARTGLLACVHAENDALVRQGIASLRAEGRSDPYAHGASRPAIAELEAASRVILLAKEAGCRVSICHVSLPETALMARRARFGGQEVRVETCPHYLLLTEQVMGELGPYAKINPPIRGEEERRGLWRCLDEGWIDYISSDHAPFTVADKEVPGGDIFEVPAGAPGLETMIPVLADEMMRSSDEGLSLLVRMCALNPAMYFGLYPRKGALQPGSDGDLVLLDTGKPRVVRRDAMYSKSRDSARLYDGWEVTGWPVLTVVRGQVVMRDGQIVGRRGTGVMVRPCS
jgi:dihydropyrimidinase/allantoinase